MEQYDQAGIDALVRAGRPIPGQSLTASPDERRPFEQPPEFTNFKEALDYTASELLLEENYMPMMAAIADGVPVVDLLTKSNLKRFQPDSNELPSLFVVIVIE